jgi:release factor glutamine methyltransferase
LKQSHVTAIDVSLAALAVARKNAKRHGVAERIEFVESDLFANVDATRRFDFVVSNPPYITTEEMSQLADDVRRYEPSLALDGGAGGTSVIEHLLPQTVKRLAPGGWLLMEASPMIATRVEQLVDATPGLERRPTQKDLAGLARVVEAQRREAP